MNSITMGFLIFGVLSILGYLGDQLFRRTRVPDVLLLMVVGVLIGPVFGLVEPKELTTFAQCFGILALVFILFEGGLELDFDVMMREAGPVLVLIFLSLLGGSAVVTLALHYIMNWPWLAAPLLGGILANTSGAIVLPVVQRMRLPDREKTILKLEAAGSDVVVIIAFITLLDLARQQYGAAALAGTGPDASAVFTKLMASFSVAVVMGLVAGIVFIKLLSRIHGTPHYYIFTMGGLLVLYSLTEFARASGAMAALSFGVVLSNAPKFSHFFNLGTPAFTHDELKHLHSTFSFFVRTFFMIYIGLFIGKEILSWEVLGAGVLLLLLLVLARYVAAGIFAGIFRKERAYRHTYFVMLPRGLAVAALAVIPAQSLSQAWEKEHPAAALAAPAEVAAPDEEPAVEPRAIEAAAEQPPPPAPALPAPARKAMTPEASKFLSFCQEFPPYSSLIILLSNVVLTIGVYWVEKKVLPAVAAGSSPAPPGPDASPGLPV